jgi:hypothetical protein
VAADRDSDSETSRFGDGRQHPNLSGWQAPDLAAEFDALLANAGDGS